MTFLEVMHFEAGVSAGDRARARWTNSGHDYAAPVEVVAVNAKSFRVRLLEAIDGTGYPEGWKITVPCTRAQAWSWRNCLLPAEVEPPAQDDDQLELTF